MRETVTEVKEDVAEMKADLRWLVEAAKEDRRARGELEGRVDKLERTRIRERAYATGFGAAAALVLGFVKDKLLVWLAGLLAAMFLTGCQNTGPFGADSYWHERQRPVDVYIHSEMRPECTEAVAYAVEFWRDRCGVNFLRVRATGDSWDGWYGSKGPVGTISVRDGTLTPGVLGNTSHVGVGSRMRSARVRLSLDDEAACHPLVVTHELGHALGLADLYDTERLYSVMFWQHVEGGDQVSDDECAWVR